MSIARVGLELGRTRRKIATLDLPIFDQDSGGAGKGKAERGPVPSKSRIRPIDAQNAGGFGRCQQSFFDELPAVNQLET